MAINVNPPPQVRMPKVFAEDREINNFFRNQERVLLQLWARTGGAVDAVSSAESGLTQSNLAQIFDIRQQIGSGIFITVDTTGFTVDTTEQTTDKTEQ